VPLALQISELHEQLGAAQAQLIAVQALLARTPLLSGLSDQEPISKRQSTHQPLERQQASQVSVLQDKVGWALALTYVSMVGSLAASLPSPVICAVQPLKKRGTSVPSEEEEAI
jgi:hypothetical protein